MRTAYSNNNKYHTIEVMEVVHEQIYRGLYSFSRLLATHTKLTLYSGIGIVVLALICIIAIKPQASLNAHPDHINTKYFTSVQVEAGDTLWGISQRYISPEYASTKEYIDEVIKINHITEDDIKAGCYITVPYYAEAPLYE